MRIFGPPIGTDKANDACIPTSQRWIVPIDARQVTVQGWGGAGGNLIDSSGHSALGGFGGFAEFDGSAHGAHGSAGKVFKLYPGDELQIIVGCQPPDQHRSGALAAGGFGGGSTAVIWTGHYDIGTHLAPKTPPTTQGVYQNDAARRDPDFLTPQPSDKVNYPPPPTYNEVVAAADGRVLFRQNLTADVAFNYRVWSDPAGDFRPLDGPIADYTPHPTGTPDGRPMSAAHVCSKPPTGRFDGRAGVRKLRRMRDRPGASDSRKVSLGRPSQPLGPFAR